MGSRSTERPERLSTVMDHEGIRTRTARHGRRGPGRPGDDPRARRRFGQRANTGRAYAGTLRRLQDWLDGRILDDAMLAESLAARFEAGHSPAVAGQVAAIRFYAKLGGQVSPIGPATARVLAGFWREGRARARGWVVGVRWERADAAAAIAESSDGSVRGLRDAALLAVLSDGLLGISEAAAPEAEGTNNLTIRRLKTDQDGERAVQYIGGPTAARVRSWSQRVSGSVRPPGLDGRRPDTRPRRHRAERLSPDLCQIGTCRARGSV